MPKHQSSRRTRPARAPLPRFNSALGEFLALPEHLEQKYSNVVTQIYPLKANVGRLQELCDSYLNLSEDLYFEATVPWVLMQVCDYGKMASTSRNVGWFSQHELAFGVPIQWYRKERNKWAFVDWAMVFPFIFVDNPLSMCGGREIYGWSKAGIQIDTTPPIFEPGNARRLVSISLVTSGTNYGDPSGTEEFLQIFQRRPFLSLKSAVSDVLTAIPRAIANSIAAASNIFETTASLPFNYSDSDLQFLQETIVRFYGRLDLSAPTALRVSQEPADRSASFNIITLKQVRDVGSSSGARFQAIVGSRMAIERTTDAGYLFDPLSGDVTGGIQITLRDSQAQPIVRTLGLATSGDASGGDEQDATMQPLLPFWLKMDLGYGLADYQFWRTATTSWTRGDKLNHIKREEILYVGEGSGAKEEVAGPYHFPHITFRVMPLRAKRNVLQKLIDDYLKNDFFEFEVAGHIKDKSGDHSVVCLIGTNFEKMSATGTDTEYSDRELTFAVPVLWRETKNPHIEHPALISLYTFTGTDWNTATSYEVFGQLALKSWLIDPDTAWLTDPASASRPPLLTVKTELFPTLGKSQEAQKVSVLEIFPARGSAPRLAIADYLHQLGLNHFWNGRRFHTIALKQIVDAEDPRWADYQALIGIDRKFTGTAGRKPTTGALDPVSIKLYDYPTLPLIAKMGLIWEERDTTGPCPAYTLKPIDPFWISGAMRSDAGCEMCQRVGLVWRRNPEFAR